MCYKVENWYALSNEQHFFTHRFLNICPWVSNCFLKLNIIMSEAHVSMTMFLQLKNFLKVKLSTTKKKKKKKEYFFISEINKMNKAINKCITPLDYEGNTLLVMFIFAHLLLSLLRLLQ